MKRSLCSFHNNEVIFSLRVDRLWIQTQVHFSAKLKSGQVATGTCVTPPPFCCSLWRSSYDWRALSLLAMCVMQLISSFGFWESWRCLLHTNILDRMLWWLGKWSVDFVFINISILLINFLELLKCQDMCILNKSKNWQN